LFPGTFAPKSEMTWELSFPGTFIPSVHNSDMQFLTIYIVARASRPLSDFNPLGVGQVRPGSVVVAPTCPQMRARWRHLANMVELVLSSVHNPNGKLISSACFYTAHNRVLSDTLAPAGEYD